MSSCSVMVGVVFNTYWKVLGYDKPEVTVKDIGPVCFKTTLLVLSRLFITSWLLPKLFMALLNLLTFR